MQKQLNPQSICLCLKELRRPEYNGNRKQMSAKHKQLWFFSHYSNCHASLKKVTLNLNYESGKSQFCEGVPSGCPELILTPIQRIWGRTWKIYWADLSWENISVEVLRIYSDSTPERCAAAAAAKSGHCSR